jgi:hypothetical protein
MVSEELGGREESWSRRLGAELAMVSEELGGQLEVFLPDDYAL